jgi:hypothetical protein
MLVRISSIEDKITVRITLAEHESKTIFLRMHEHRWHLSLCQMRFLPNAVTQLIQYVASMGSGYQVQSAAKVLLDVSSEALRINELYLATLSVVLKMCCVSSI